MSKVSLLHKAGSPPANTRSIDGAHPWQVSAELRADGPTVVIAVSGAVVTLLVLVLLVLIVIVTIVFMRKRRTGRVLIASSQSSSKSSSRPSSHPGDES